MIVLDTNVVIYYLKANPRIVEWLESEIDKGTLFVLSAMSIVELLGFPGITPQEIFLVEQIMRSATIIDVDISIARIGAVLRKDLRLTAIDSVIAATAITLQASLASRDMAFRKIRDIRVISP